MIRNGEHKERVEAVLELAKECSRPLPAREVGWDLVGSGSYHM
jgi:hypothetical protein